MNIYMIGEHTEEDVGTRAARITAADVALLYDRDGVDELAECSFAVHLGIPLALASSAKNKPPEIMFDLFRVIIADPRSRDQAIYLTSKCIEAIGEDEHRKLFIVLPDELEHLVELSESPLEQLFAVYLSNAGIKPVAQYWLDCEGKRYRIDFALVEEKIAIEVDGHDFHERTKEQAQHDRSRDRALQLIGWRILRFTGSEVYRDPLGCVSQLFQFLEQTT